MPTPLNLHFTPIAKETNQIYKKNFLPITGIIAITSVVGLLLVKYIPTWLGFAEVTVDQGEYSFELMNMFGDNSGLLSNVSFAVIVMIGLSLLGELIDQLGTGGIVHFCTRDQKGKPSTIAESLQFGVQNVAKLITLMIQVFIYTWAWLPIGVTLILIIGVSLSILPEAALVFLPIAVIVGFLAIIKRLLSAVFATPLFFMQENPDSTKALETSIAASKNILGTIFSNYFVLSLILGIAGVVISVVVAVASPMLQELADFGMILYDILTLIPAVLIAAYASVFSYVFAKEAHSVASPSEPTASPAS